MMCEVLTNYLGGVRSWEKKEVGGKVVLHREELVGGSQEVLHGLKELTLPK